MSLRKSFRVVALQPVAAIALALAVCVDRGAFAQAPPGQAPGSSWSGTRPSGSPWSGVGRPATPEAPKPAPPSDADVVARVEGRPITRQAFDRLANPYLERLRAQFGAGMSDDILRVGRLNVLAELMRREVVIVEAQRQKIPVLEQETDSLLRLDPFFRASGTLDPLKFSQFKLSPTSNYTQVLPQLREMVAADKLEQSLRRRFTPTRVAVRAEWARRNDQVAFKYFPLLLRDVSLDPEATEQEREAYYHVHPDEFMKKTQLRLRYYKLPLPPEADSGRAAAESEVAARARRMADSLSAGTLPDSSETTLDTGLFDVPGVSVPGLGRIPGLTEALARADSVASARVVGPFTSPDGVIVGAIVERKPRHLPPLRDVLGAVKRRADAQKRQAAVEADRRAFYEAHRESYRGRRVAITRLTLSEAGFTPHALGAQEIERWYQAHGRTLFGQPDTSKAWIPPLGDSLRGVVRLRIEETDRSRWLETTLEKLAAGLRANRDARAVARANGAVAETLGLAKGDGADSLFTGALVDSILAGAVELGSAVQGPRAFGRTSVLWRVDAVDTTYLPPFERVRVRVEREFADERRTRDEDEGRAWFDAHRDQYVIPVQHAIEYVPVTILPPDSVRIPEAELRARYAKNRAGYRQEEEVRARHILISTAGATPDARARALADSLLGAVRGGADFVDLAKRFSQEPGAAGTGGDLGWFGRGRMVKEFENAVFALDSGKVSSVVRTQFGYHIVKVEERKRAGTKPFEDVRREIHTFLATARADSDAARAATALRRKLALGGDLRALAAARGGTRITEPFDRHNAIPGLGMIAGLGEDLGRLPAGRWAPKVYRAGRSYLVLRPVRSLPSRPAEFEEVKGRAVEDSRNAKREDLLERKVESIRAALAAGATLDSLSAPYGGLKDSGPLTRGNGFVPGLGGEPRVVEKVFGLKPGEQSDTLKTAQGRVWVRVETRSGGDEKAFEATLEPLTQELLKKSMDEWIQARKKTMRIEVLRPDLREPEPERKTP